jgi:hypothetical protein
MVAFRNAALMLKGPAIGECMAANAKHNPSERMASAESPQIAEVVDAVLAAPDLPWPGEPPLAGREEL